MLHASNTIRNTIEKGNTYCYKNIDYDNEIRVLKVYPGLPGSAIICCLLPCPLVDQTLQPALPSSIPYAALSYCWGSDEAVNKIYFLETDKVYTEWKGPNKNALDGMVRTKMVSCLLVGSSLKDALETLRSRSKEAVFLWADALCINQKNLVERTAQVSRMHDVYTQAETVYIWLGTGKDEGKAEDPGKGKDEAKRDNTGKDQDEKNRKTLAFLTKILDLHELEMVVKRLEEREANANWLEDKQDCKRTIELMGAQWFSRRWVIQELALARSASVLFGNCEMPWRDFADAIALFMTKFDQIKAAFPAPKNYAALRTSEDRYINSLDAKALGANVLVTATSNLFRKSSSGRIIQRLLSLELLVSSMLLAFEATDPRDTVFAVLQIAKDISPRNFSPHRHSIIFRRSAAETLSYTVPILGIILWTLYDNSLTLTGDYKANYRKCLKDVCADFIEYCIENSNSLDIICRHWAPLPKPPAKVDMPSWILPISGNAFGGPAQAKKGRVHGDSFVGSEKGGFYTASGSRTPVFKFGK
ncbi:heterokaryon incompatibility protein-domain-containing protein, partial [Leptodontidium sp. MPI-SDFR-AT-0119]